MIKVLHTIDTTGPGGAETVFINLIKGLDPRLFSSFAAITGPGWVCDELQENGIKPFFISSQGGFNLNYLFKFIRTIRKNHINLVQSHLLGSNLYACMAGLICRVPVIATFHGFVDTNVKDPLMPIKRILINYGAAKIVFVSKQLRDYFIKQHKFSSHRSITIYNGINESVFRPQRNETIRKELGLKSNDILIGAIGNVRPAKGYSYFIKAARMVVEKYPRSKFIIVGHGEGKLLEEALFLRRKLGLDNVFFFLGYRSDVAMILNNLDIFVLSSISEGFSLSTAEAMACGIPVIITQCGGPEEFVVHKKNGIVVKPCNVGELANGILCLISSLSFRRSLITSGLRTTSEFFSLTKMITTYQNVYNEISTFNLL